MSRGFGRSSIRTLVPVAAALLWLGTVPAGSQGGPPAANGTTAVRGSGPASLAGVEASPRSVARPAVGTSSGALARLPQGELRALAFLCKQASSATRPGHTGAGHSVFGPVEQVPLASLDQAALDRQWSQAATASLALATPEQASAGGYVQAAPFNVGVGAHWIKWSLVGKPFNPATPAMLLFDGIPGRPVRLVGFSYWVGSRVTPEGFAGRNDHWHRHSGLCFTRDGWLGRQDVATKGACKGYWLGGGNLWMLHAWVVPGLPNRWGGFAPTNPDLCPPPSAPDILLCR